MRTEFLPFSKPTIGEDAIDSVVESLRSGWVAMGPKVLEFERRFANRVGCGHAVAVSSATAGLHTVCKSLGIGPKDEIITTPMTFAATLNAITACGATPVLADIDEATLNISPDAVRRAVTPRTKALMPVHFAGLPCDMDAIEAIAAEYGLALIEDAAHALGASYKGTPVGADRGVRHAAVFSFHPTKNITTAEGGMICTGDEVIAEYARAFRQNGMSRGAWNRHAATGSAHYDVAVPGLKYQMTDIQAAIGLSQMECLNAFNARRAQLCALYRQMLSGIAGIALPAVPTYDHTHAHHIFPVMIDEGRAGIGRDAVIEALKARNIGSAVHYRAVHLFSHYAEALGLRRGDLPAAERVSDRILSLPLFPAMTDGDAMDVIDALTNILAERAR